MHYVGNVFFYFMICVNSYIPFFSFSSPGILHTYTAHEFDIM